MASTARQRKRDSERIPFYRNVKTIGLLAQLIFVVVVVVGIYILYDNVTTALERTNIPADFSFLDNRAGIPIAESPIPYDTSDSYARAFLIGFLNTLKVALVGVLLASLLGVLVGVMRLSGNWILRQIGTMYVETLRNVPLAVQIIFWFSAVLTPLPPRILNPIELPGGFLLSNLGFALPWPYPTYSFPAWLPWLVVALAAFVLLFFWRRQQIARADRPGNPWPLPLLVLLLVAGVGYWVAGRGSTVPQSMAVEFLPERGRATVYLDQNDDGDFDRREPTVAYMPVRVRVEEGYLIERTQDLTESRGIVRSIFRFPPFDEDEYESAEVRFLDPEASEGLELHYFDFPSDGLVYRDLNQNDSYDPGEELMPDAPATSGYVGVGLVLELRGFQRRLVSERDGVVRIPQFQATAALDESAAIGNLSPAQLFGVPAAAGANDEAVLEAEIEPLPAGPMVISRPTIPTSRYVGGIVLSVSYLALLLALVTYTASFIAEIVRGGILAVPRGQTEAAKALGLSGYQTFTLVVFPQAMRIILPPMISQYLNLTKNSSLATLAAYVELFFISVIIANQTGASVPVTIMLIASYIFISLIFSLILNFVNARVALVER